MAETDGPLKRLVSHFSTEFATWLLRADVRQTRPLARACRRIHLEVIETSALSFSQFFSLCFGSISISYPSSLLGQCHDISNQFVQIE